MKVIMISKYFMPFLFNIINYSPKIINIQRREAELNIKLPRVNNFDIKKKKGWNICFIVWHHTKQDFGR